LIKLDIINEVVNRTGITKTKAEMAVETVFESMKKALGQGERIELRGFGIFNVRPRKTGIGRNPRTGAEVSIPPGKAVRFKPGKESQGYIPGTSLPVPSDGTAAGVRAFALVRSRPRYWLHILLFVLTFLTTTSVGAVLVESFREDLPPIDLGRDLPRLAEMWSNPVSLAIGLPFSLTLMVILLAHELGHYLACRYYRIDASLPYFLPAPTFIGTLGAFIRIRAPIYSKKVLFDIGIAGPLAGFVVLLPALAVGLAYSKVLPGVADRGDFVTGVPPLIWLLEKAVFPGVASADIYLHPVARAAWVGIFATALNLLPIGQLDGGHILYSMVGERHRLLSKIFIAALVPLAIWYWPWLLWAVLLYIFARRHPPVFDPSPLSPRRRQLGYVALAIFVLCFMVAPLGNPAP
jgi:nucleoid DNA-binding protein/Zn-dependent protease